MLKILYALFACLLVTTISSCSKSKDDNSTTLAITVTDVRSGNVSASASVSLYTDENAVTNNTVSYSGTTGSDGKVSIKVPFKSQYYIIIQKGQAANFYSGYIPVSIFQSQAEVNNSPFQSNTTGAGDVKFRDTNGDGKITVQDKVIAPTINLDKGATNVYSLRIF